MNNDKTFKVHYSFYLSDSIEVVANTEEEAREKIEKMIEDDEIGNLNEMDIGEQNLTTVINSLVEDFIKEGVDIYKNYNSVLEFCDEYFTEDFYKLIDPNELIHLDVHYSMNETGDRSLIGSWMISGIMECYDYVHNKHQVKG